MHDLLSNPFKSHHKCLIRRCFVLSVAKTIKPGNQVTLHSKNRLINLNFLLIHSEINGILVCYKTETVNAPKRPAPPTPTKETETNHIQQAIDNLKLNSNNNGPVPPPRNKKSYLDTDDEYEVISPGYQVSPKRQAPQPPELVSSYPTATLYYSTAAEVSGIPFEVSSTINKSSVITVSWIEFPLLHFLDKTGGYSQNWGIPCPTIVILTFSFHSSCHPLN